MATDVEICNYALDFIGKREIASLSENQREAELCNRYYDMIRKSVLRDHKWNFAVKSVALAAVTDTDFVGWDYAFSYPTDALYATKIYNSASDFEKIEYEIRTNSDKTKKYIMCDEESPTLIYVADVDQENLFDALFIEAFAYKLAATLVIPLKGEMALQQMMMQNYSLAITKAKAEDSNERYKKPSTDNSLLAARN
jgi:hypothetical protein